ncbi:hypothetical protein Tcan_03291 [Toxocara canis]|uniref:Serine hydrolase domain-containing protein n=1 Tax=Toxocara canis TaxID=6265 RepID=A0A0B2V9J4_TOXCA|nr:hypothetical protein Tcan_03291 [Toxocara canis]
MLCRISYVYVVSLNLGDGGPFDGILAFSQGAALAFLLAALRQRGGQPLVIFIYIDGSGENGEWMSHVFISKGLETLFEVTRYYGSPAKKQPLRLDSSFTDRLPIGSVTEIRGLCSVSPSLFAIDCFSDAVHSAAPHDYETAKELDFKFRVITEWYCGLATCFVVHEAPRRRCYILDAFRMRRMGLGSGEVRAGYGRYGEGDVMVENAVML